VNDDWAARFSRIEFPYMCSMWAPYCNEDHLQLVVDWNNWVRAYIYYLIKYASNLAAAGFHF
jgi:hypothetical protein